MRIGEGAVAAILFWVAAACYRPPAPVALPPTPASLEAEDVEYLERNPLMVPVEGVRPDQVRDSFSEARDGQRVHSATDILAPRGTPVLSVGRGRVFRMSQNALGGITIYTLDESGKFVYYYAHLERYSDAATVGLELRAGDVLGYVGTSGNAPPDTPHLHFQAMKIKPGNKPWWSGTPVDVRPFFKIEGKRGR
ncbi:MAG: M23 family metallopeptidase [Gemmatimonadaceae bacterium]|nr:M23 family metallopeptidase [Gemmatimonadaceae bacterium]